MESAKQVDFVRVTRTEVGRVYIGWGNVDALRDDWCPETLDKLREALAAGEAFDDSSDGDMVVYYPTSRAPEIDGHDAERLPPPDPNATLVCALCGGELGAFRADDGPHYSCESCYRIDGPTREADVLHGVSR